MSCAIHLGSATSGHFIAFVKRDEPPCWYELGDTTRSGSCWSGCAPWWTLKALPSFPMLRKTPCPVPNQVVDEPVHLSAEEVFPPKACSGSTGQTHLGNPAKIVPNRGVAQATSSTSVPTCATWLPLDAADPADTAAADHRLQLLLSRVANVLEPCAATSSAPAADRHEARG